MKVSGYIFSCVLLKLCYQTLIFKTIEMDGNLQGGKKPSLKFFLHTCMVTSLLLSWNGQSAKQTEKAACAQLKSREHEFREAGPITLGKKTC